MKWVELSKQRKFNIGVIMVALILGTILDINLPIPLTQDKLYWLFSTVAQVFAALFALSVTVILILNQKLHSDFSAYCIKILPTLKYHKVHEVDSYSDKQIVSTCRKLWEDNKDTQLQNAKEFFESLVKEKNLNLEYLESFAAEMIFIIIISVLALINIEFLSERMMGIAIIGIVTYLSIYSLIILYLGVKKLLESW